MATDHQRDSGPARPNAKLRKMMEQAELAKEREFYRYYQRPKADGGILSRQPSPVRSLAHALPAALPPSLGSPQPSEDKALTAFAQLGALRLNTRRCLISFFDRRNCYILAEATKTLSLHADQAEFKEDSLCWGATIFPKEQSICYYTVNLPVKFSGRPLDDFGDVPSLVVNDLSQDQRFKNYPFVIGPPYSRFYAGVPIRSPNGHSIGTYCVLDDKPRNGLSAFELDFLKDMAVTVMRHLEMNRATDDYRRGGIMVKSLGSFAEGKSGLEDWWMDPWDAEPPNSAGPTDTISLQRQRRSSVSFTTSPRISHEPASVQRKDSIDSSIPSAKSPNATSPASGPSGSVSITPASEVMAEQRGPEVATKTASSTKDHDKDRIAPEITAAFSRAANMIVDATEAEGAVFFDAKISTFGGLVDDDFITEQPPEPDKPCTVLGYAHCKNPPYPLVPSNAEYSLSESVLRHLLRTYSHGQIFNFDDDIASPLVNSPSGGGELETSDGFPFTASRRSESTKSSDDENLLRSVFPKARSLVLYPLWDPHRDRWFASAIIWSSDPMRVFTSEQELSYLAAFSNSVMAEVARLDTKLADAAKADFISSISHELRSPLHGILGMTDLLKDTSIDVQQTNQVHTIETCGKTLLDTINHVLDFAKINNLTRGTSKRRKKRSQSAKHIISPAQGHTNDIMTLITDVDLAVLTEEALESVFAGYNFQKTAALTYDLSTKKDDAPPIAVIVDINKSDNYVFRTQPGAWRRVIMNLFGNALKYTPAGYIKVKLQVMPKIDITDDSCEFRITITDSGIGMSEDYVNNRLFHSFAQENPLSQGTGLGLSIVKQIVESLGGDIEVRSEKGRGTKFSVSCPLKESILSPTFYACGPEKEKERELLNVSKRTKGMVVRFVGFDEEEEYFVKSLKNKTATMLTLKALDNLCTDWFGLTRCYSSDTNKSPDLFIANESGARILRSEHSKHPDTASKAPVIVLCQGAESAQVTTAQSATAITVPGQIFECIAQPIGPHKLAKALTSCLDRHANRLMAATSEVDIALPNVSQLSLKENTPPMTPKVKPDLSRPHITSAISAPEVRSVHNSPVKQTKSPVRSLNCLAVDDNPINLRLLRTFVEKLGHRHILATNGLEAFETYKKVTTPLSPSNGNNLAPLLQTGVDPTSRIDVILMDINMPEMDGLEATRQIRSHEIALSLSPVTIIALTGLASSEAQQEAHSSGVNLFLIKPVRLADLEVVLKGVVTGQESVSTDKAKDTEAIPAPPGDITPKQNQIQATIPEIQEATVARDTITEEVHEITPMSILQKDEIFVENAKEVAPKEVKRSQEREEGRGSGAMFAEQKSSVSSESLEPSSQSKQEVPSAEAPQLLNHNENHIPVQQLQNVQEARQ